MNASGNWTITARTNTSGRYQCPGYIGNIDGFPEELLTEGQCEMDVSTYVFWYPAQSVKQYKKIFKDLSSNKWGQGRRNYQFLMCRAEVDERGQTEVLGMVQFEKELDSMEHEHAKYALKYLLDPSRDPRFFHEIQDCNVNNVYLWLKKGGTGKDIRTFKHGVFVGNWRMNGTSCLATI